MTPRESLEAAGWKARYPEAEARWFSPDISDSATYSQKEALAQLARDEAKETSDGQDGSSSAHLDGDDRTSPLDTVVPDKAAPVAMSVSAPDWCTCRCHKETYRCTECCEGAFSSSAALLAANEGGAADKFLKGAPNK